MGVSLMSDHSETQEGLLTDRVNKEISQTITPPGLAMSRAKTPDRSRILSINSRTSRQSSRNIEFLSQNNKNQYRQDATDSNLVQLDMLVSSEINSVKQAFLLKTTL